MRAVTKGRVVFLIYSISLTIRFLWQQTFRIWAWLKTKKRMKCAILPQERLPQKRRLSALQSCVAFSCIDSLVKTTGTKKDKVLPIFRILLSRWSYKTTLSNRGLTICGAGSARMWEALFWYLGFKKGNLFQQRMSLKVSNTARLNWSWMMKKLIVDGSASSSKIQPSFSFGRSFSPSTAW